MNNLAPHIAKIKAGYAGTYCGRREPLSSCCGAPIEKAYRSFSGPSDPDHADYTERVCSECGEVQVAGDDSR